MAVIAGKKCIAALDAVGKALGDQEIERAIDLHGRNRLADLGQPFDDVIGAHRPMA